MAKRKNGVNKSAEIRGVLSATPTMSVKDVVATLKERGIEVNESLVYGVKKSMAGSLQNKAASSSMAAPQSSTTNVENVSGHDLNGSIGFGAAIKVARAAADKVGGWATLKEIVDAMQ